MQIRERSCLVCGGASGLGAATVRRLVHEGARVLVVDLNAQAGQSLVAELQEQGAEVAFAQADSTNEEQVQAAIAAALQRWGTLDAAIHCAGIALAQRTVSKQGAHALEAFARVIGVNLVGSFNVSRLCAAAMARNAPSQDGERGVIVLTASIAAFDGQIGQVAYAASKAGVAGMTLPMARDLASLGIRVVTIAPGLFDTPLLAGLPEAARTQLGQQVPFPSRLGAPTEFADLAMHILANPMLNGEVIRLDGALRMPPRS